MKLSRLIAFVLFSLFTLNLFAAPSKNLWPRWQENDPKSIATIDHKAWRTFLKKYVHAKKGINLVAYDKVTPEDKQNLQNYINYLESIKIDHYNRKTQEAFWIDLYNAETVNIILEHYPVKSILDISLGWFNKGPWDKKVLKVEGESISLNDIEHRILRPIWNDPRIHYALNCASYSCPNLQKLPYTASNINWLLENAAEAYINSPRAVEVKNGQLILSSIYKWYRADFGNEDGFILYHLGLYAKPKLRKKLAKFKTINSYHYNWALNQDK